MYNKIHKKILTIFSSFLILAFLSPITIGQTKKELSKKLDKINGKVTKISIQTDKGTINFSGKEAEEILKKLKKKEHKFIFSVDDNSLFDIDHNMVFFSDDDNMFEIKSGKDGITKLVEVKEVDGKKEVTIKTTKDGKTTIKTLKGKEAEEYLDKQKIHSKHFSWKDKNRKKIKMKRFKVKVGDNSWFGNDDVIILKDKMRIHFKGKGNIEKEIEINVKDGVNEVTVTSTKDGKETVKVYKGKEAEEFLENLDNDDNITIDIDDKDNFTKIIIIKKEKKTKKDK